MSIQPPECLKKPLFVPHKLLMGAGPSNTSPRVLYALGKPTMGHLHTETTQVSQSSLFVRRYDYI